MSYETDLMQGIKYRMQDLSASLKKLGNLDQQIELSNQLAVLQIKIELGLIDKTEAIQTLESLVPTKSTKRFR